MRTFVISVIATFIVSLACALSYSKGLEKGLGIGLIELQKCSRFSPIRPPKDVQVRLDK